MIELQYPISFADYKAASRLFARKQLSARAKRALYWCLCAFMVLLFLWNLWMWTHPEVYDRPDWVWVVITGAAALVYPFLWTLGQRRCYRNMFPTGAQPVIHLTADEGQLILEVPGFAEGRYSWNAFQSFAEDNRTMILLINKGRFLMVPRRTLNDVQWEDLRTLVAARIAPKQVRQR